MDSDIEYCFVGNLLVQDGLVDSSRVTPDQLSNKELRKAYELLISGVTGVTEIAKQVNEQDLAECFQHYSLSIHRVVENNIVNAANARMFEIEIAKALALVKNGTEPSEALESITIKDSNVQSDYAHIGDTAVDVYSDMQARVDGTGSNRFIKTGLNCLDNMIGGLERGSLTIIGARASMGKTSLGMDLAIHIAKTESVCFNSIEMDMLSIGYRVTSLLSNLNLSSLRIETQFPADVWRQAAFATQAMGELNLSVNDDAAMTVPKIIAQARRHKKQHGLAVLMIDYLGLIKSNSDKPRHLEIAEMTRALKGAAKELDCAVVLLSQLNRAADGEKPTIANLSDSTAVENDADLVLFPYRPKKGMSIIEEALLIIGKNRNGPVGELELRFHSKVASFKDRMEDE